MSNQLYKIIIYPITEQPNNLYSKKGKQLHP